MDKLTHTKAALSTPQLNTSLSHDASDDFILPEYMPPIRRVVSVEAAVLPESRFLSGAALELGGTIAYNILYIGEDNALSCAPVTAEYTASCALGETGIPDASCVGIDTTAENITCRVTGPHACTIRTRMKTRLLLLTERPLEEQFTDNTGRRASPADEIALERLIRRADDVTLQRGETTATISGSMGTPAGARVIRAGGAVRVEEARAAEKGVEVRGEVMLHALCLGGDGRFFSLDTRAPFGETVGTPDCAADDFARAWGRVASVTLHPGEGEIGWEMEYDLEAEAARPASREYTADAYSTACASEIQTEEIDSLSLLRCGVSALTVSGESGRQSKPQADESVVDVRASAQADHVESGGGQLALHGIAAVSVLIGAEGDIAGEEFTMPFRAEIPARGAEAENAEIWSRCAVEVVGASARLEGDKLAVTLELSISMLALGRRRIAYVRAVTLDHTSPHSRADGTICIYYPDAGESMWEIGKRYAVRRSALGDAEYSDGSATLVRGTQG